VGGIVSCECPILEHPIKRAVPAVGDLLFEMDSCCTVGSNGARNFACRVASVQVLPARAKSGFTGYLVTCDGNIVSPVPAVIGALSFPRIFTIENRYRTALAHPVSLAALGSYSEVNFVTREFAIGGNSTLARSEGAVGRDRRLDLLGSAGK
jgi:hypothetical protein